MEAKADAAALEQSQKALEAIAAYEAEDVSSWSEADINAYLARKTAALLAIVSSEKNRIAKAIEDKLKAEAEAELARQLEEERVKKEAEEKERKAREAEEKAKREAELAARREEEKKRKEEEDKKRREAAVARGEDPDADDKLRFGQAAALDKERTEAIFRIPKNPGTTKVDLTDPDILEAFLRMRNDEDPLRWFVMAYKEGSKNVLYVPSKGEGGFDELVPNIPDDPCFIYINYSFGDTNRSKFCFLTFVPDSLAGLAKSRVVGHRPHVEKFLKYFQVGWHVLNKADFVEKTLVDMLLKAGGANYSVQEEQKGDFSSYKKTTKDFYNETEKKGKVDIVYDQGPLSTTPVDISGRASVAPPTDFLKNTSSEFKGKKD